MAASYTKPANLKYTDLAIYIDNNMAKIKNEGEYPEVECKIYEYLYHIIYALSYKAGYFRHFYDYDQFACYAAGELYMTMRNKLNNNGQEVRGKVVVPIKSSLNFIKATMFPLKINYQRDNFSVVIDPQIHDNVNKLEHSIKESIQQQYRPELQTAFSETVKNLPLYIAETIKNTPFRDYPLICKKLCISVTLTLLNDLTIPTKIYRKLTLKLNNTILNKAAEKLSNAYKTNEDGVIVWHIDLRYSNYIRILTNKVKKRFSKELDYLIHMNDLSDNLIDSLMRNVYENVNDNAED